MVVMVSSEVTCRCRWWWRVVAEVPFGVVTRTATAPTACAGLVAVTVVLDTTVNLAEVVPNFTDVAPVRSEPVIVTLVPPVCDPDGRRELRHRRRGRHDACQRDVAVPGDRVDLQSRRERDRGRREDVGTDAFVADLAFAVVSPCVALAGARHGYDAVVEIREPRDRDTARQVRLHRGRLICVAVPTPSSPWSL